MRLEHVRLADFRNYESLAFDPQPVIEMKEYLENVSKLWGVALARLKKFVESDQG